MKYTLFITILSILLFSTPSTAQKLYFDDLLYCVQHTQENAEGYLHSKMFYKAPSKGINGNLFIDYRFGENKTKQTSIAIISKLTVDPKDKEALFNFIEYHTTYKSVFNIIKNEAVSKGFKYDGKVEIFKVMADVYRLNRQSVGLYKSEALNDTSYVIFFTEQTE